MTLPSVPATAARSARVGALLLAFAFALGACSFGSSTEEALDAPGSTKDSIAPDENDESADEAMDTEDETLSVTPDPEYDEDAPDDDKTDEPESPSTPPGTINDLEDLIGNESEDGLGNRREGTLVERFVALLLEEPDEISEAEARCVAEMLDERLSETSFELLVTNIETMDEIEDGIQFTNAELTVISESLANCLDYRSLVDEIVEDQPEFAPLVDCLSAEISLDAIEALFLFEVLGENGDRPTTPIILTGIDVCPNQARAVIEAAILDEFLLADAPAIEACLAGLSNAELRPFFDTEEFSVLIALLREQCLL